MSMRSQDWVLYCWGYYEKKKRKHVGRIDTISIIKNQAEVWSEEHRLRTVPLTDILVSARTKNSLMEKIKNESYSCEVIENGNKYTKA